MVLGHTQDLPAGPFRNKKPVEQGQFREHTLAFVSAHPRRIRTFESCTRTRGSSSSRMTGSQYRL